MIPFAWRPNSDSVLTVVLLGPDALVLLSDTRHLTLLFQTGWRFGYASYADIAGLNGNKDRGCTNTKHVSAITVTGTREITIPSVGP